MRILLTYSLKIPPHPSGLCRLILVACWFASVAVQAQVSQEVYMDWEEFLDSYFDAYVNSATMQDDPTGGDGPEHELEQLELLHREPLNLNAATREQLAALPFLTAEAIDSILSYRQRHHRFLTLGELQFVRPLTYRLRRYLSLFAYAGDTIPAPDGRSRRLLRGRHELRVGADFPLYRREGYRSAEGNANHYYGPPVAHSIRYRHTVNDGPTYGFALANDAGEPFARGNSRPYDYWSAYAQFRLAHDRLRLWLGDYELSWGEGLLMGQARYGGRTQLIGRRLRPETAVHVHSAMTESGFARGVALGGQLGRRVGLLVFGSYRRVDGHPDGDTITSLQTSGLHRTHSEILGQRALGVGMAGARLTCRLRLGELGAGGYAALLDRPVWPRMQEYNRYYLRGRLAGGAGVDFVHESRRWNYRAELSVDAHLHAATSHTLRLTPPLLPWTFVVQTRWLSPRYVAPYAHCVQMAGRVQNESGGLIGAEWRTTPALVLTGYVEYSHHRRPMYRVSRPSHRIAAQLQGQYSLTHCWSLDLRYLYRMTQRDVVGHNGVVECRHNHSWRMGAHLNRRPMTLHLAADLRLLQSQTTASRWGTMLSARGTWRCNAHWQCSAMAALFHTDDYDTRIFAYEPQLPGTGGFPTFAYHGARWVTMVRWSPLRSLSLGLRYGGTRYFNRRTIGSGPALIHSPLKNDLSVQLTWQFDTR